MKTCRCAVCGEIKTVSKFGDGITVPRTTCLQCKVAALTAEETKTVMFVKRTVRRGA